MRDAFGREDVRTLESLLRQEDERPWQYIVNGDHVRNAYVDTGDRPSLREELNHHRILPKIVVMNSIYDGHHV